MKTLELKNAVIINEESIQWFQQQTGLNRKKTMSEQGDKETIQSNTRKESKMNTLESSEAVLSTVTYI